MGSRNYRTGETEPGLGRKSNAGPAGIRPDELRPDEIRPDGTRVKGQTDLKGTFECIAKVGSSGWGALGQALAASDKMVAIRKTQANF